MRVTLAKSCHGLDPLQHSWNPFYSGKTGGSKMRGSRSYVTPPSKIGNTTVCYPLLEENATAGTTVITSSNVTLADACRIYNDWRQNTWDRRTHITGPPPKIYGNSLKSYPFSPYLAPLLSLSTLEPKAMADRDSK